MDFRKLTPERFRVTKTSSVSGPGDGWDGRGRASDWSNRVPILTTSYTFATRCALWGKNVEVCFHASDDDRTKPPLAPERFPAALEEIKSTLGWIETHRERIVSAMIEKRAEPLSLFNAPSTEGMSEAKFRAFLVLEAVTLRRDGDFELTFNPWETGSDLHLTVEVDQSRTDLNACHSHYQRPL